MYVIHINIALFIFLVPEYEVVHIHRIKKRSISTSDYNKIQDVPKDSETNYKHRKTKLPLEENNSNIENLKLQAFGKKLNLSLVRNEGLFKKSGLKIWTVEPNATAQHGVEYVEIPHVSLS